MELWEKIIAAYPEIKPNDDFLKLGIWLQDDSVRQPVNNLYRED